MNHTLEGIRAQASKEDGGIDSAEPFACPADRVPLDHGDDIQAHCDDISPPRLQWY